jgi:type I restriction enzyme R subunit
MSPPGLSTALASEEEVVEAPALALLEGFGWAHVNLMQEKPGPANPTGRTSYRQHWLPARLMAALQKLNPTASPQALQPAADELTRDRSAMLPANANREVIGLLRDGVPVEMPGKDGKPETIRIRAIDWLEPANNDFLIASQFWIAGPLHTRRPDAVGFVNGLPLLLAEWKAPTKPIGDAYQANIRDYRDTVPQIFDANAFVVLSNGLEALMGASHAPFEFFAPWKKLAEGDTERLDLETLLKGTCRPDRFLDLVENFLLFEDARGGMRKVVGKYHQVLGVNRAMQAVASIAENQGRLGVFWHTQGSGKSLSMVMFAEKVLRRLAGDYTFVIVTDRTELDDQIASTFAATGALKKAVHDAQAGSRAHLRDLLAGNERYVFTLIQKFSTADQEPMPVLSERRNIIVITDEAHRSQYDQLAANMRAALPNAAFIGFTGTPLIKGEESRTREVFGDYVSVYDFAQSVRDGATVPLFYEARLPEMQLNADGLREDLEAALEEAMLSDEQDEKLRRQFAKQYTIITNPNRLDKVADDLVRHFSARGYRGKAMFVAIDKATAVAMHDRAKAALARLIAETELRLKIAGEAEGAALHDRLADLKALDMAVVVSQGQNEIDDLKAQGLDILPHRKRMQAEDLEAKFKNPDDPLRLVFVCAMWITGFDVPSIGTVYIDKPMKNHTLMQTIARANRRAEGKTAGVIVDYVGVFRSLERALAIYAGSGGAGGESPIKDKAALLLKLQVELESAGAWAAAQGVNVDAIIAAPGLERTKLINAGVEALIAPDERRREFFRRAAGVVRAYKALLPDEKAAPFLKQVAVHHILVDSIRAKLGPVDISAITAKIAALLDEHLEGVDILAPIAEDDRPEGRVDLSAIDFDKLAGLFATQPKTAAEQLKQGAEAKVKEMVTQNPSRIDLVDKLEELVARYNAGVIDPQTLFELLQDFVHQLNEEEDRAVREGLSQDELAIYDLLTRPEPALSPEEEATVKMVASQMLKRLERLVGVPQWVATQQTRAAVRVGIREELNALPERPYPDDLWKQKVEEVWDFVLQRYGTGARTDNPAQPH